MKFLAISALLLALLNCSSAEKVPIKPEKESFPEKRYAVDCYSDKIIMINELGLTDEQAAKIILIDERYSELYLISRNEIPRVRLEHRKKIESVLTKQQRKRFLEAFLERYGEK